LVVPVDFAKSNAGEYCFSLFAVVVIALLVSWVVAVVFAPLIGVTLLPATLHRSQAEPSRLARLFRRVLLAALRAKYLVIGATLALLALSLFAAGFVEQQFFPSSDRPELLGRFRLIGEPIRGSHQGRRPSVPHLKAAHMTVPTPVARSFFFPCAAEAVTHGRDKPADAVPRSLDNASGGRGCSCAAHSMLSPEHGAQGRMKNPRGIVGGAFVRVVAGEIETGGRTPL